MGLAGGPADLQSYQQRRIRFLAHRSRKAGHHWPAGRCPPEGAAPAAHDHLDRAAAMLDADPDLRIRASAADAELAAGIQHAQDDGTADYDLASWGA